MVKQLGHQHRAVLHSAINQIASAAAGGRRVHATSVWKLNIGHRAYNMPLSKALYRGLQDVDTFRGWLSLAREQIWICHRQPAHSGKVNVNTRQRCGESSSAGDAGSWRTAA